MLRSSINQRVVTENVVHRPTRSGAPVRRRGLHDVYARPAFNAVLHHERNRADREETEFSLILVKVRSENPRLNCRIARAVLERARTTDEVGWYGKGCLCVLLPNTTAHGARCFDASMRRIADARGVGVVCRVYTYPSQWILDANDRSGNGPRLHRDASSSEPRVKMNGDHRPSEPAQRAAVIEKNSVPNLLSEAIDNLEAEAVGLDAVESLLVQPMPLWKRLTDIATASMALIVLCPVMSLVALLIKLTSPGPVLFGQWRAGLGGKPFWIYKFRTMRPDAEMRKRDLRQHSEQDGPAFKMRNDPRITSIGRVLRTTSLDELPQLWNVLRGDMSLVGPRPLPLDEAAACHQWQRRRLDLTPGLTCIWQVKGRSRVTFAEWMRMDLAYARSRTLLHDMKIMAQTVPAVLLRRGAR